MRLEIKINTKGIVLPFEYHHILQGIIYRALDDETGSYYHNDGYSYQKRKFKMFVFSELRGKYTLEKMG